MLTFASICPNVGYAQTTLGYALKNDATEPAYE